MSGLLLDKPLLCYQPALVRVVGLAGAAVIQQLQYWTNHSTNSHDGHVWVYKTYAEWSDEIGISAKAVRGALQRLRDDGFVIAIQSPIEARDRTLWWRINYTAVNGPSAPQGRPHAPRSDPPGGEVPSAPGGSSHVGDRCSTETTTETTTSLRRAREDAIPDGFPDELRPHARAVTLVLRETALERGANAVTIRAVGRAVMDYGHKPLVRTAMELRAWLLDGAGRAKPCADVVRRYRDWLRREQDLAGLERLADDGTPATAVQHPPGVVPLNGRRQSRGERQGETIRTLLRSAGEIP